MLQNYTGTPSSQSPEKALGLTTGVKVGGAGYRKN